VLLPRAQLTDAPARLILFAGMLMFSAAVLAQALASIPSVPPTQPAPPVIVTHEWYGYQTLAIDVPALTLGVVGFATGNTAILVSGSALYALGPPLVHVAHGRLEVGLSDLGIRILLPVAVTLGALLVASPVLLVMAAFCEGPGCASGAADDVLIVGVGAGVVAAVIADAAALSSVTRVHHADRSSPTRTTSWSLVPFARPAMLGEEGRRRAVAVVGVGGTF